MFDEGIIQEMWIGKNLERNSLITRQHGVSLVNCFRECTLHSRCVSVNYFVSMRLCDLNSEIKSGVADLQLNSASVYSEKGRWILGDLIPKVCRGNACSEASTKCKMSYVSHEAKCVKSDCGKVPSIPYTKAVASNGIGIFSKVVYTCSGTHFPLSNRNQITCLPNGSWSTTTFQCGLTDCVAWRNTMKAKTGVYTIKPADTEVKVQCDMETENGGWTVLHARNRNDLQYNRTWNEYRFGFGDAASEYWIGNDI